MRNPRKFTWTGRSATAAVSAVVLVMAPAVGSIGSAQAAVPTATTVNAPPGTGLNILAFPQRDFISASGYLASDTVQVSVIHPSGVSWTTNDVVPQPDPTAPAGSAFAGIVDVNHPGGACWPTTTPDIRPEDKVRITITANTDIPGRVGRADETTVRGVRAGRPVQTAPDTVQIHGTAVEADGTPIPVGQLDQRMVAGRDAFLLNGRRTLRATSAAGADGSLSYDTLGSSSWTATYTGLLPADVTRALGAESRVLWLPPVVAPAVPTEGTIYENGAGVIAGPAGPQCTAPLERIPPPPGGDISAPAPAPVLDLPLVTNGNTVALSWTASSDDVGVIDYGVYRDGVAIATVQNADASAPAPTTFTDSNVPPGTYTYTVDAGDAAGNRSAMSGGQSVTSARPVAALPAGTVVHEPPVAPVQIISFPARDFISSSGFAASDTVQVQLLRKQGGSLVLVSSATQIPQPNPLAAAGDPFAGIVEVNHPGGVCFDGTTPDMRAGDVVRAIVYGPDGTIRTVEQTTTANVVTKKPVVVKAATGSSADGIIEVHGSAINADGGPIPAGQVEQRLIANRDAFDLNARRAIRAGGAGKDGTFSYDTVNNATGVNWTATYTGLSADDVARAVGGVSPTTGRSFVGAESRVLWLSATPAAAPEITIYENDGAVNVRNGPSAAFCTSPQEPLDTAPPTFPATGAGLSAVSVPGVGAGTNDVQLSWAAASDDVAVYGYRVYRDGKPVRNVGAGTTSYLDKDVVGTHTYTVDATDAASPGIGGNAQGTPYGNRSAQSDPANVTVADVSAPSVPANLVARVAINGQDVTLTWSASSDNVAVAGYGVFRRAVGTTTWTTLGAGDQTGTSYADSGVAVGSYEYTVDATDAVGNRSAKADPPATANAVADTTPPSDVNGVAASNAPDIHGKDVAVSWKAASDNVGVTGYGVYRNGTKVADVNTPSLSYLDVGLAAGTYRYSVDAVDSAGNRSQAASPAVTVIVANDPPLAPHGLIAFPARDFISATGYLPGTDYTFTLIHPNGTTFASTTGRSDATGTVEVNHPGGACWLGTTPNMSPGDVVRITAPNGVAEQTTVADVVADRPLVTAIDPVTGGGTVQVHGTARNGAGNPLPLTQVENRLVANRDPFDLNGRRTVRAGGPGTDGTLSYDAAGSTRWTATYRFQTPDDLARAVGGTSTSGTSFVGAESRGQWLGRNPAALTETTIAENGTAVTGGPAVIVGCTSGAAEVPAPGAALSAAPSFPTTGVGSTSTTQTVTLTNSGTGALSITKAYIAGLNPSDFVIGTNTATGATVAPGASVSVSISFKPTTEGLRQANLSFTDDAANTTDQTVPLVGSTPVSATRTATAPVQSLAAGSVLGLRPLLGDSVLPVDLRWTGSGPSYQLQVATGPSVSSIGGFTDVSLANSGATSTTVNLRMGTLTAPVSYQLRVRACSGTSCGGYATGPKFTLQPIDDAQVPAAAYKGTWTALSGQGGYYNETVRSANSSASATIVGPTVTFSVSGNVAWVGTRGPDRGLAQVQVDGASPQVVDLYAPTEQLATVVWARDALAAGNHTISLTVLGRKSPNNPSACTTGNRCARVDFDMAAVIR